MIANNWKITSKIKSKHILFWKSNGGQYLTEICEDKDEFYEFFLAKEQYLGLKFLYDNQNEVLFGNEECHRRISEEIIKNIKFNLDSRVERLDDLFVKQWPLKTGKGIISFAKRKLDKSNVVQIKNILINLLNEAEKEDRVIFKRYLDNLVSECNENPDSVIEELKHKVLPIIDSHKKISCTMRQICKRVFDYERFQKSKNGWGGNEFVNSHINRCWPFCGRQYVTPYLDKNKNLITSAQIDHFIPKEKYPYFSISLLNLSPICGWCNLKKSDYDTLERDSMLNPNNMKLNEVNFRIINSDTNKEFISTEEALSNKDKIKIKIESISKLNKLAITNEQISVEALYQAHSVEVIELLKKINRCSSSFINKQIESKLFTTADEVKMFMFGDILSGTDSDRPLMKLSIDILNQFYTKLR